MRHFGMLSVITVTGMALSLGGCVTSDADPDPANGNGGDSALSEWLDATNFANGVEEFTPLPDDQVPQGVVSYDGSVSFIIDSLGDVENADRFELIAGSMSADVDFSDNSGSVAISGLSVIQVPDRDESQEGPVVLSADDVDTIGDVSGAFSGAGQVLVDFDNSAADPFALSGDMNGSYSDGTTFSVSGDLEAEMSVQFDEQTETAAFLMSGTGEVGSGLEIEVDGVVQETGGIWAGGIAVEGGF